MAKCHGTLGFSGTRVVGTVLAIKVNPAPTEPTMNTTTSNATSTTQYDSKSDGQNEMVDY